MGRSFFLSLGLLLAGSAGTLWLAANPEARRDLAERLPELGAEEPEPVLVLLVGDAPAVTRVRATISSDRVVAETSRAFALREGRIVAANPEAAGDPLNAAGWAHRPIELWSARAARRRTREPAPRAESQSGPTLAELARKPTLTPAEAVAALRLMGP